MTHFQYVFPEDIEEFMRETVPPSLSETVPPESLVREKKPSKDNEEQSA